jgi:hypothetical protein
VPDVRAQAVVEHAHRRSLAVASSDHALDDQAFVDTASAEDE